MVGGIIHASLSFCQPGRGCALSRAGSSYDCAKRRRNLPAMIGAVVVVAANHIQARMPGEGALLRDLEIIFPRTG